MTRIRKNLRSVSAAGAGDQKKNFSPRIAADDADDADLSFSDPRHRRKSAARNSFHLIRVIRENPRREILLIRVIRENPRREILLIRVIRGNPRLNLFSAFRVSAVN
jgi:hypothetical protein